MTQNLKHLIKDYINFPVRGIIFKDILPLLQHPDVFSKVIEEMSESPIFKNAEAIISIDARGFIFGSAISLYASKPMVVARKPGKLPGELLEEKYSLEYGEGSLSIQKKALKRFNTYAIVDDLLATGGTVNCVSKILKSKNKIITGILVVVELKDLGGRSVINYPVQSIISIW